MKLLLWGAANQQRAKVRFQPYGRRFPLMSTENLHVSDCEASLIPGRSSEVSLSQREAEKCRDWVWLYEAVIFMQTDRLSTHPVHYSIFFYPVQVLGEVEESTSSAKASFLNFFQHIDILLIAKKHSRIVSVLS